MEDLIWRFWSLVEGREGGRVEDGGWVDGVVDVEEGVVLAVRARMEGRFLGAVGACVAG